MGCRSARGRGGGGTARGFRFAASFADDVALVATSWGEVILWVEGYGDPHGGSLSWAWMSRPGPPSAWLKSSWGANEAEVTAAHVQPRLKKAMDTAERLRALPVPSAIAAHLWRSTVLVQALYGCEVRNITAGYVKPLFMVGWALTSSKEPLSLSQYRAAEVVAGRPLGAYAVRDPPAEIRARQLQWLVVLANLAGLVGIVHRALASRGGGWVEPTPALAAAAAEMKWVVTPNLQSALARG